MKLAGRIMNILNFINPLTTFSFTFTHQTSSFWEALIGLNSIKIFTYKNSSKYIWEKGVELNCS